jgi:hypothetical protein
MMEFLREACTASAVLAIEKPQKLISQKCYGLTIGSPGDFCASFASLPEMRVRSASPPAALSCFRNF